MPIFGYGCAVFMQSDIVDFQRQGWKPEEIMAGLAAVLPKNIWLYVAADPRTWPRSARNFVLQGGTQHNLAAVKSQVDFIESRFKGKDVKPEVMVHEHCGESGAIGAAIEAVRLYAERHNAPRSSASTRCRRSATSRTATRTRAATSARTSACARSSTSTWPAARRRGPASSRKIPIAARTSSG